MRTVSLAVLACTATSACRDESPPASRPVAPKFEALIEAPPAPSVATPPAPAADRPGGGAERRAASADASSTTADLVRALAVAWYDSSLARSELILLCDSSASWVHSDIDSSTSCVPDGQTVYVIDPHGVEPWSVRARERGGRHLDPELVRPRAQYPDVAMPVLVLNTPTREADARLVPLRATPPSAQARAAARAVAKAAAAGDSELVADDLPLTAVAEVRGTFGGEADTIAVFQVDSSAPDLAGHQVLAALADGNLVGTFGASPLQWGGYQLIGATDLDGDRRQELLWWANAEGAGIGVNITYFSDGTPALHNLLVCECGDAFRAAYPRQR